MDLSPDEFHPLVELAAERTSESLLCLDTEGKILFANDASGRTLGQTAVELLGKSVFQIAPEMNPSLWRELWKEIRVQTSFAFEFALTSSGKPIQVDMTIHFLKPSQRELACVFFRDIEERKRLKNLQQEFVSTASHELRTPMTVIREGVSQVLEGLRGEVNASQHRALSLALNGIDRLGRIIDELLDMSKIESGKISLKRERVDIAQLAREAAAVFQSLAADRKLELSVTTPPGPVIVYADRDRLTQVLTNLINNSFKFTERGQIHIAVMVREGEVECSVTDSGIGLSGDDADKMFNKFEQLGRVAFTGEKGTGLGLSICRGIIDLHKGRIWAQGTGVGKGARVAFAIPQQSGQIVFREILEPMLRDVARRGGNLATVVFQLNAADSSAVTDAQRNAALAGLETFIRQQSGRMTDVIVKDRDAMYLALQSMVKREGARIADHVIAAFKAMKPRDGVPSPFEITYEISGFPEDQSAADAYLDNIPLREAA